MHILGIVLMCLFASACLATQVQVEHMGLWSAAHLTRVVFNLSGPVDRTLTNGYGTNEHEDYLYAQEITPQPPIPLPPEPAPPSEAPPVPTPAVPVAPEPEAPVIPEAEAEPEERPESEKPAEQLLLEAGGVLLPKGTLQLEPSVEYSHISNDRIAISGLTIVEAVLIGTIRVDDIDRDIVTGRLTGRYGLTDRIQLDTRIPGVYRQDREVLAVAAGMGETRERTIDGFDLGDIEAGISWQALYGRGAIPDAILRLDARFPTGKHPFEIDRVSIGQGPARLLADAPTGSGFYGVGAGTTFVWRVDPVVFFAGGNYKYNFERDFDEFGDIEPGDTIDWFGGLNVALSEQVSLNLSFVDQITRTSQQNGIDTPGSSANDGRLVLGTSVGLSPTTSLLVTAGAGLTDDSPDFTFTVSLPWSFSF